MSGTMGPVLGNENDGLINPRIILSEDTSALGFGYGVPAMVDVCRDQASSASGFKDEWLLGKPSQAA